MTLPAMNRARRFERRMGSPWKIILKYGARVWSKCSWMARLCGADIAGLNV
jgi:hypothetical protein